MTETGLLGDIFAYVDFLRSHGYGVSVCPVRAEVLYLFPHFERLDMHQCALCDYVKYTCKETFCYRVKGWLRRARIPDLVYRPCPFGVEEFILPVREGEETVFLLFLSGYHGRYEMSEGKRAMLREKFSDRFFRIGESLPPPPTEEEALALLKPLCHMLRTFYAQSVKGRENTDPYRVLHAKILAYIGEHFAEDCTVADISRALGYSEPHLRAVFRRMSPVPIAKAITKYRLAAAARLLTASPAPIGEIAASCGFSDPDHFSVLFRQEYRKTPRQYRKDGGAAKGETK